MQMDSENWQKNHTFLTKKTVDAIVGTALCYSEYILRQP